MEVPGASIGRNLPLPAGRYMGGLMLKLLIQDRVFTPFAVCGVPVRLQTSALSLPMSVAAVELITGRHGWESAGFALLFILLLYACGLLHELGHVLPARATGATVTQVRLSGMGLFVQIRGPHLSRSSHELLIALGGPLVSALLACGLGIVAWRLSGENTFATGLWPSVMGILVQRNARAMLMLLAVSNALLAIFNLLPAFPMDGGRALSALLALFLAPPRAAILVASLGQIMAVAMLTTALLAQNWPLTVLVLPTAGFVFWVSWQERRHRCEQPAI
jgi:Zn-dependent protease